MAALYIQAMNVIAAPAVAPATPKHVIVDKVGQAPFVFAVMSGEVPVVLCIQSSILYLAFW